MLGTETGTPYLTAFSPLSPLDKLGVKGEGGRQDQKVSVFRALLHRSLWTKPTCGRVLFWQLSAQTFADELLYVECCGERLLRRLGTCRGNLTRIAGLDCVRSQCLEFAPQRREVIAGCLGELR